MIFHVPIVIRWGLFWSLFSIEVLIKFQKRIRYTNLNVQTNICRNNFLVRTLSIIIYIIIYYVSTFFGLFLTHPSISINITERRQTKPTQSFCWRNMYRDGPLSKVEMRKNWFKMKHVLDFDFLSSGQNIVLQRENTVCWEMIIIWYLT